MTDRHRLPRRITLLASAVLGVALAVTGCSGGGSSNGSSGSGGGGTGTTTGSGSGSGSGATGGTAAPSGTDAKVVASTTITVAARGGGTVGIGLVGLRVDGQLATLDLVVTPHLARPTSTQQVSLYDIFGGHSPDVALVDNAGLKRYTVVRDSGYHYLQSDAVYTRTPNNQPVAASYTFAAPPAAVHDVDVYVEDRKVFTAVTVAR